LAFVVIEDRENPLLNRREVVCLFPSSAGKITRADVVKTVSQTLNVPSEQIIPIRIEHSHGVRDTKVTLYIFRNAGDAKKQLPKHILQRLLPKEERKKLAEQKSKPKEEKKQ
jgi:ribosomal protein S24E